MVPPADSTPRPSLAVLAAAAARRLESAGLPGDEARRDAARLARWCLGWDAAAWITRAFESPPLDFPTRYESLIARRVHREPVSLLTGEREFCGHLFLVTPDVLTPRPETEQVVSEALEVVDGAARSSDSAGRSARVADVGTGSGCLAITLALERPALRLVATDESAAALDVARRNARRLGVADRIQFEEADLLGQARGPFQVIVSNPPYIPDGDRTGLVPEVRDYDPPGALFAGPDGLDVIRRLLPAAAAALEPGGVLIMEIGQGQADEVSRLVTAAGLHLRAVVPDLRKIPRVVVADRPRWPGAGL